MISEETRSLAELINDNRHDYNDKRQELVDLRKSDESLTIKAKEFIRITRELTTLEGIDLALVTRYKKSLDSDKKI